MSDPPSMFSPGDGARLLSVNAKTVTRWVSRDAWPPTRRLAGIAGYRRTRSYSFCVSQASKTAPRGRCCAQPPGSVSRVGDIAAWLGDGIALISAAMRVPIPGCPDGGVGHAAV